MGWDGAGRRGRNGQEGQGQGQKQAGGAGTTFPAAQACAHCCWGFLQHHSSHLVEVPSPQSPEQSGEGKRWYWLESQFLSLRVAKGPLKEMGLTWNPLPTPK